MGMSVTLGDAFFLPRFLGSNMNFMATMIFHKQRDVVNGCLVLKLLRLLNVIL